MTFDEWFLKYRDMWIKTAGYVPKEVHQWKIDLKRTYYERGRDPNEIALQDISDLFEIPLSS